MVTKQTDREFSSVPVVEENEYILGTNDEELARLGFQHRVWAESVSAIWERAGFHPGQTLLDVGCGPGYTTLDLAQLTGSDGKVIGIDVSDRFIAHLCAVVEAMGITNVDARQGDAQTMQLEPASVDGAYCRWMLCFLEDPEAVVQRVADALRPGCPFAVQDYSNYSGVVLGGSHPAMDRVVEAVGESWRLHGGDPDIALRLPGMMERCGLEVRDVRPLVRTGRPGSALWQWPTTFFRTYMDVLIENGLLTEADKQAYNHEWAARTRDPASLFQSPPMLDVIGYKR